jgi:hypothetical protein
LVGSAIDGTVANVMGDVYSGSPQFELIRKIESGQQSKFSVNYSQSGTVLYNDYWILWIRTLAVLAVLAVLVNVTAKTVLVERTNLNRKLFYVIGKTLKPIIIIYFTWIMWWL